MLSVRSWQIKQIFFFCNRMRTFNLEAGRHIHLVTATFGDLPGVLWCLEVIASLMCH